MLLRSSLLLLPFAFLSCSLGPPDKLTDAEIAEFNQIVSAKMKSFVPVDRSGENIQITRAALDVLHEYDETHNKRIIRHYPAASSSTLSKQETLSRFVDSVEVLVNLGVIYNYSYKGWQSKLLIKLGEPYQLKDQTRETIKEFMSPYLEGTDLEFPIIYTTSEPEPIFTPFTLFETSFLDPKNAEAEAFKSGGLDKTELLEVYAAHEVTHAICWRLLFKNPELIYSKIQKINEALDGEVHFHNDWEVLEFLADAIHVQVNDTGIRFSASRLRRPGPPIGELDSSIPNYPDHYSVPHDVSALFILKLLEIHESENQFIETGSVKSISWLVNKDNKHGNIAESNSKYWKPYLNAMMAVPGFKKQIRDEYASVFHKIFEVLL